MRSVVVLIKLLCMYVCMLKLIAISSHAFGFVGRNHLNLSLPDFLKLFATAEIFF